VSRAQSGRNNCSRKSADCGLRNIDLEIPDGQSFIDTSRSSRQSWKDKLDTLSVTGATDHNKTVLYSSFAHTLVYPYEIHESTPNGPAYYSGYLDKVVSGESYSGYSIWDTYRAETAWLILNAPERVPGQINSMLQDYREGGWLPMWKNLVETNIMVGTHSDSIIAQAIKAGVQGVDWLSAWEAVKKNAYTPPDKDTELQ
jgi:putative alpha-1,2-mannosidase